MCWIFLLKYHFDVWSVFQNFYAEVKNLFDVSLKILRTDNALEYTSSEFSQFCTSHGILHHTSCSYTSQQNGVVECKNRHLLDIACTQLFHMNVPKRYWADAVLTASFFINHMPTSVLGKSPFSILFPSPVCLDVCVIFTILVHN